MKELDEKVLIDNLDRISYTLDRTYLDELTNSSIVLFEDSNKDGKCLKVEYPSNIRALQVTRWTFDKEQRISDCLKNVLSTFSDGDHTLGVAFHRLCDKTEMYFIIQNVGAAKNEDSERNIDLLEKAIKGNFPGSEIEKCENLFTKDENDDNAEAQPNLFALADMSAVSILVNSPCEYVKDAELLGIDKVLNGIVPEKEDSYWVLFISESLSQREIRDILNGYEELATSVSAFASHQFQYGKNENETKGEMKSLTFTDSINKSISKTHSLGVGASGSAKIKKAKVGLSANYGYSRTKSEGTSFGKALTAGTNYGISVGSSESTTYTYKSYGVNNVITKLEKVMSKIELGQANGLWRFATYVFATDASKSVNIANFIRGLSQGNDSYVESSSIQTWTETSEEEDVFTEIRKYVTRFMHPVFSLISDANNIFVTPTTYIATNSLAQLLAFPKQSMQGLPVACSIAFGREPHAISKLELDLELGIGYHMRSEVKNQKIAISKEELKKHTFITGSTGSGKSNTVYKLLEELNKCGIKFMVIEPAKGEYRKVMGVKDNVYSYGTNPNIEGMNLLRINPFEFPPTIHILEHLDRIIEVFNVCWPMYAAMPAILKDAIEKAYEACGWDLETSSNKYDDKLFPSFTDVVLKIREVLNDSEYSEDNKGDYTGALVTRVKSLCNGINGLIFTSNALADSELFDRNVIVDLSRVGSSETKSLIMGLLIIKMQEYRMVNPEPNSDLSHITVLEEAHNLLKRSNVGSSGEGSNMQAKSVEMLANSIAEMRTYGEGFVIADQAPGLLDMAVIRNTNTKIIMRLPDVADRELVGKAAGLSDSQIEEVGRLETGVAVISQSGWLEPILCKVSPISSEGVGMENETGAIGNAKTCVKKSELALSAKSTEESLLDYLMNIKEVQNKIDPIDYKTLKEKILMSRLDATIKVDFLDYINQEGINGREKLRKLLFDFLHAENALKPIAAGGDICKWAKEVLYELRPSITEYSKQQQYLALALIVYEKATRNEAYVEALSMLRMLDNKGGVY